MCISYYTENIVIILVFFEVISFTSVVKIVKKGVNGSDHMKMFEEKCVYHQEYSNL